MSTPNSSKWKVSVCLEVMPEEPALDFQRTPNITKQNGSHVHYHWNVMAKESAASNFREPSHRWENLKSQTPDYLTHPLSPRPMYQTTRCHVPEDCNLDTHRSENLNSGRGFEINLYYWVPAYDIFTARDDKGTWTLAWADVKQK
jgi:hypothetical protein